MNPIDFKEKTKVLKKPDGMTDEECRSLAVWNGDKKQCISCWKGNIWDRLRYLFTGKVWIYIWYGQSQPPVYVGTEYPLEFSGEPK